MVLLKLPFVLLTAGIWAVVGLAFWIPLLFRVTAVFSMGVLYAAITRSSTTIIERQLHNAVGFYTYGFSTIFHALHSTTPDVDEEHLPFRFGHFFFEIVFAAVFWSSSIYGAHSLHMIPSEWEQRWDELATNHKPVRVGNRSEN